MLTVTQVYKYNVNTWVIRKGSEGVMKSKKEVYLIACKDMAWIVNAYALWREDMFAWTENLKNTLLTIFLTKLNWKLKVLDNP